MKAIAWMGKKDMQVQNVPDPKILNARDAIVKVTSTCICGSDLHMYNGFMPGMEKGDIMGHEFMGEVVELGPGVKNLKIGDRVVVPFPISCGACNACQAEQYSLCENSNPNAWMLETMWGHAPGGVYGYSHLTGGFAGGQAEYARVPYADVGPLVVPDELEDEQVIFLTDVFPTGYMAAEMADIRPGAVVAVWGAGPVGQFAAASARLLGAEKIIVIDRLDYRLNIAREHSGAITVNYEEHDLTEALMDLTAGRGPDCCIDAVGMQSTGHGALPMLDRAKQAARIQIDRPTPLREAIMSVRNGGNLSIIGDYMAFIDQFPVGSLMNRSITVRTGQAHVQRYMRPLLERIVKGEIDPRFIITHRMPLERAPEGYQIFNDKEDECLKIVLKTNWDNVQ
jgi:threonine dehydrogenase-like Zn-dependent dehydrogenase